VAELMASNVNPAVPGAGAAYTADMRANFAIIKIELEDLQFTVAQLDAGRDIAHLPLTGGALRGVLELPPGNQLNPGLAFGEQADTGFYRGGQTIGLTLQGTPVWLFNPSVTFCRTELDLSGHPIGSVGDAVNATDALNVRTGDRRYAQIDQVDELNRRLAELERRLLARPDLRLPSAAMQTALLVPPE
jgi:hypothetical protein